MTNLKTLLLLVSILIGTAVSEGKADPVLKQADLANPFAVGVVTNYVRDYGKPFDTWGRKYKPAAYQELLNRIEATGTPRTTVTQIYYPTLAMDKPAPGRAPTTLPAALPAARTGTQIDRAFLFGGNKDLIPPVEADNEEFRLPDDAVGQLESARFDQAYQDAPVAKGRFPLIIMVHGLGGDISTFADLAEHVASQGYIVVTVSMISDDVGTAVFEDPDSAFAQQASAGEIEEAYDIIRDSEAVFYWFSKYLYDYEGDLEEAVYGGIDDIADIGLKPSREGAIRSGNMMGELFEQRVEDVQQVIFEMKDLNRPALECQVALGTAQTMEPLCGFFADHIDVDSIAVLGESLGSMTAQASGAFIEDVDVVVGLVNGMPRRWEPYGGMPGDAASERPDGVQKPFLQMIGSDDFFVHSVFRIIHWQLYQATGGNPVDNYPLPDEQLWPTEDNPSPVALSAYNRAGAEKMLLTMRDQGHGTSDIAGYFVGSKEFGLRVPLSPDAEPDPFEVLGWVQQGGYDIYLPNLMENYFVTNWFDWHLKRDESARLRLLNHPFDRGVKHMRETGVASPIQP